MINFTYASVFILLVHHTFSEAETKEQKYQPDRFQLTASYKKGTFISSHHHRNVVLKEIEKVCDAPENEPDCVHAY